LNLNVNSYTPRGFADYGECFPVVRGTFGKVGVYIEDFIINAPLRMKATLLLCSILVLSLLTGCSKNDMTTNSTPNTSGVYFPLSTGSFWQYTTQDSTSTLAAVRTVQLLGKTYVAVYDYSSGDSSYLRRSGTSVYTIMLDTSGTNPTEVKILEETPGAHWSYDISLGGFSVHADLSVTSVAGSRVVNGKTYTDLIMLESVSNSLFGSSTTDTYLAKNVGEIESIEDGVTTESLLSYHIQ
jgi:hypothetical protein